MKDRSGRSANVRSIRTGEGADLDDHVVQTCTRGRVGTEDLLMQSLRNEHPDVAAGNPVSPSTRRQRSHASGDLGDAVQTCIVPGDQMRRVASAGNSGVRLPRWLLLRGVFIDTANDDRDLSSRERFVRIV